MLKLKIVILSLTLVVVRFPVQANEIIPFVPSPMQIVHRMLELAELKSGDVIYDMGSGDGRIIIEAAKKYGVRGVGIDLNAELVARAKQNALREGVGHLTEFRAADGLTVDISDATVVTLYMFKWFNNQMRPKLQNLRPGSRVVAHDFDIDDWKPTKVESIEPTAESASEFSEPRTLYFWRVEPPAMP